MGFLSKPFSKLTNPLGIKELNSINDPLDVFKEDKNKKKKTTAIKNSTLLTDDTSNNKTLLGQ